MKISLLFAILACFTGSLIAAPEWQTLMDKEGRTITAKVVNVEKDSVTVLLKNNKKTTIPSNKFTDADWLKIVAAFDSAKANAEKAASSDGADLDGDPKTSKLYPRSKDEIKAKIKEIMKRPVEAGVDKRIQEATNILNVYRYLCGVPSDVKPDATYSTQATDAANACKTNGGLSHDLGHATDKCNLSTMGDFVASVSQYIDDAGDNNRERRGHRQWCLHPPMSKAGFGTAGDRYSAMYCFDNAEQNPPAGVWSYPGRGLFPLDYMHGNAWSIYGTAYPGSADKVTIELYRLNKRPDKPFVLNEKIPGTPIKINYVSLGMMKHKPCINFEPDEAPRRACYWVKVKADNINESFVVEFF